jgi:hypothetical protein
MNAVFFVSPLAERIFPESLTRILGPPRVVDSRMAILHSRHHPLSILHYFVIVILQ